MGKYVTKPQEIEAVQWNGKNLREITDFVGGNVTVNRFEAVSCFNDTPRPILASKTDYIVKDNVFGFSVIDKETFNRFYEPKK